MRRYFLALAYHGAPYHGWQRQPRAASVQQVLEEALATLLRHPCPVVGAGRTDAGVHATRQFAHFDTPAPLPATFLRRLNGLLPPEVAACTLYQTTDPELHARFSATSRAYTYYLARAKDPFAWGRAWQLSQALDLDAIAEATTLLLEGSDFASFCKAGSDEKTTLCHLYDAHWACAERSWEFHIRADRFLRGMVRAIVGTLVLIGRRKLPPGAMSEILAGQNRALAGPAAPAKGLFLTDVSYPTGALIEVAQIL